MLSCIKWSFITPIISKLWQDERKFKEISCCINSDLSRVNLNDIQINYGMKPPASTLYSGCDLILILFDCVFNHKTFFLVIRFQYGLFRFVEATRLSPSRNRTPSSEFKMPLLVYFNLHFFFLLGQCNEIFTYSNIFIHPLTSAVDKHTLGDKKRHFQVPGSREIGQDEEVLFS